MGKKNSEFSSSSKPKRGRGGRGRGSSRGKSNGRGGRLERIIQDWRPDSAVDEPEDNEESESGNGKISFPIILIAHFLNSVW